MSEALAVREPEMGLQSLGGVLAGSGFFKDTKSAGQAIVKVLAGRELGIGPIQAMTGIHVIEGKIAVGAGLLGALVKRSGRYNYTVPTLTDKECVIEFTEKGVKIGQSKFSMDDAAKAGVAKNPVWSKYPRNMLFARAMSNGVRWYCADVTAGPVYVPEELGQEVNGEGDAINVQAVEMPRQQVEAPKPDAVLAELKERVWKAAHDAKVTAQMVKTYSVATLGKEKSADWTTDDCEGILLWIDEMKAIPAEVA